MSSFVVSLPSSVRSSASVCFASSVELPASVVVLTSDTVALPPSSSGEVVLSLLVLFTFESPL